MDRSKEYQEVVGLEEINKKAALGWRVISAERSLMNVADGTFSYDGPGDWVALMEHDKVPETRTFPVK